MSSTALLAFVATSAVIIAVPGPSLLFTIGRALSAGRREALLTVAGNALGLLAQAVAVAVGLGAVLAASAAAYTIVKLAGASYLIYLGVQAIRHRHELAEALAQDDGQQARSGKRSLVQGLTVGVTNPKTLVFLSSLLPQFIDRSAAAAPQIVMLGAIFAGLAAVGDSIWAIGAARARQWFARSPQRLGRVGGTGGALMAGLGVTLALTGRPSS